MRIPVTDCLAIAARIYNIPKGQILERRRFRPLAHARQNAMLLAIENGNTKSHIARVMGFDHTTINQGVDAALSRRDEEWKRQGLL